MTAVNAEQASAAPLAYLYSRFLYSAANDRHQGWHHGHPDAASLALYCIGETGYRLITVLAAAGGVLTEGETANETAAADPAAIETAITRLIHAGLLTRRRSLLELTPHALAAAPPSLPSLNDSYMITSGEVATVLDRLSISAPSNRKDDRIAALAEYFASPSGRKAVFAELSSAAAAMLKRLAEYGTEQVDADLICHEAWRLHNYKQRRYGSYANTQPAADADAAALIELADLGIIGIANYDYQIWIWAEAWPLLQRPFVEHWPTCDPPTIVAAPHDAPTTPRVVSVVMSMLTSWPSPAPKALKNNEPRLAVATVKSLAKTHQTSVELMHMAITSLIRIGLVHKIEASRTGRGRRTAINHVWAPDQEMVNAWRRLEPAAQWLRIINEFTGVLFEKLSTDAIARALTIWQLGELDDATGYDCTDNTFAQWLAFEYSPGVTAPEAEAELQALRELGIVEMTGPLRLTALARTAATNVHDVYELIGAGATTAYVQADLTITAPAALDPALEAEIATIAIADPDVPYPRYRLDEHRLTTAMSGGRSPDDVLAFLADIATGPLPDTVTRLVADAAKHVDKVTIIDAPTVVIFTDPHDLTVAVAIKSNKLVAISDTVAITDVAATKLQTSLTRKGMSPTFVSDAAPIQAPTREESAAALRDRAHYLEQLHGGRNTHLDAHIDDLIDQASYMVDIDAQLRVDQPPLITPAALRPSPDDAGTPQGDGTQ